MIVMTSRRWALAAVALATALALGLSWCILRSPLTLYDGLGPILDARRAGSTLDVFRNALGSAGYFRPLRLAQIKAIVDLAPADPTAAFKAIHVALTLAACILFALLLRVRSAPEFAAAAVALMIFVGHHSFFILIAEAYPVNHFLEMLAIALGAAVLARGEPRWWKGVLGAILLLVGLLTLESGVLIWLVIAACWLVGWRGISGRALLVCTALLLAYFWVRFGVLHVAGPGLDERATGFGLTRLEPKQIVERFGANPLPFYASNVVSAFMGVLFSQPRNGTWIIARRWLDHDVAPWMWIHLLSSTLVTVLLGVCLIAALGRWRRGALQERDRFVLLAFAIVGANAILSYAYVKDEVLSIGSAFYAAGAYAMLVPLAEATYRSRMVRVGCAVALVCASVLWTTRAAGCFYSLRAFSYRTANDWGRYSLERELPRDAAFEPTRRLFLELRHKAIRYDVPIPRFTNERHVQRYVEIQ